MNEENKSLLSVLKEDIWKLIINTALISLIPLVLVIGYNNYFDVFLDTSVNFLSYAVYIVNIGLIDAVKLSAGAFMMSLFLLGFEKFIKKKKFSKRFVGFTLFYFLVSVNLMNAWSAHPAIISFSIIIILFFIFPKFEFKPSLPAAAMLILIIITVYALGYSTAKHSNMYINDTNNRVIIVSNGVATVKNEKSEIKYTKLDDDNVITNRSN